MNNREIKHVRPEWLRKKVDLKELGELKALFRRGGLHTVCEEAMCPNISECFRQKIATFLILGDVCTRSCAFCAVKKGVPSAPAEKEPVKVAEAVKILGLKHVVVTSVTRDDLEDGGASVFKETIDAVKKISRGTTIEVLVPDFMGHRNSVEKVLDAGPEIFAHNLETVPSLYEKVRKGADYQRSLGVLSMAKKIRKNILTKSGLMLGLGEKEEEVIAVMRDLRASDCDFLSLGQYLSPSKKHYSVVEYVSPERFDSLGKTAFSLGFTHVESAPYVRSSYFSSRYLA